MGVLNVEHRIVARLLGDLDEIEVERRVVLPEEHHEANRAFAHFVHDVPERDERPGTFDFLGFTHYWGRTLKGNWAVKRKTAGDRLRRSLASVGKWCREHRHDPVKEQWAALTSKLRGHFAYYGITGNFASLRNFRYRVTRAWHKWLCRRSTKARIPWERFGELEQRYPLPPARLSGARLVT